MAPGENSEFISSCTTARPGHAHPCCPCLQGSHKLVFQRERGLLVSWAASKIRPREDSHHQGPSSHLWVTGAQARTVGALLLSSDQATGTRPWEVAVTHAGRQFPTWSLPCMGQDAKCYLLRNVKSEIDMKSTDTENWARWWEQEELRGLGRVNLSPRSVWAQASRISGEWAGSPMPSPTSKSTEIPPDPLP